MCSVLFELASQSIAHTIFGWLMWCSECATKGFSIMPICAQKFGRLSDIWWCLPYFIKDYHSTLSEFVQIVRSLKFVRIFVYWIYCLWWCLFVLALIFFCHLENKFNDITDAEDSMSGGGRSGTWRPSPTTSSSYVGDEPLLSFWNGHFDWPVWLVLIPQSAIPVLP